MLLPNDPQNYYASATFSPPNLLERLGQAKILITNFHAFQLREKVEAGKLTKAILAEGEAGAFTETPDEMVRRVCRELGNKKNIIVINDEAHHCYRRKPDGEEEKLTGDERKEAETARRRSPHLDLRPRGRQSARSASRRSTTSPPRPSSCAAPATRRARSSPGSSPTSP